jgi:hypothetical protein
MHQRAAAFNAQSRHISEREIFLSHLSDASRGTAAASFEGGGVMNQQPQIETQDKPGQSEKQGQRSKSAEPQSQSQSGGSDRTGTSQGHDDPGSAPESGDKNP